MAGASLDCDTKCALGNTLHQVYENKTGLATVLYNDEPPGSAAPMNASWRVRAGDGTGSTSVETAHAKGILAYDGADAGFFLIHSVPKFPDLRLPKFTWTASTVYGQSFLCMSLDAANIDKVAANLRHSYVEIFSSNGPTWLQQKSPNFASLIAGSQAAAMTSVSQLTSRGGTSFVHFAKSAIWGRDLYEDLVAPSFKMGFMWETWRRNPYTEPTYCSGAGGHAYDSVNVMSISFGTSGAHNAQFPYTRDHCKWGISLTGDTVCVGDINRMSSQKKRGGGVACFRNTHLWTSIRALVASTDGCAADTGPGRNGSGASPTPN